MIPQGGLLFLDPGVTTGLARCYPDTTFWSGELSFQETGSYVKNAASAFGSDLAICWERFDIGPMTYRQRGSETALEVIGVVRYLSTCYECRMLPPSPRVARTAIPRGLLSRLGWRKQGMVHANDAAAHLASFIISHQQYLPGELHAMISSSEMMD